MYSTFSQVKMLWLLVRSLIASSFSAATLSEDELEDVLCTGAAVPFWTGAVFSSSVSLFSCSTIFFACLVRLKINAPPPPLAKENSSDAKAVMTMYNAMKAMVTPKLRQRWDRVYSNEASM